MRDPIGPLLDGDKEVVKTLLDILAKQEEAAGLPPCPELPQVVNDMRRNRNPAHSHPNPRSVPRPTNYPPRPASSGSRNPNGMDGNNWRKETRSVGSGRVIPGNQQVPFVRNDGPPRTNWKDLGSMKYRTGIPEMDFMASAPQIRENWHPRGPRWEGAMPVVNRPVEMTGGTDGKFRNGANKQRSNGASDGANGGHATRHLPPSAARPPRQFPGKSFPAEGQAPNRRSGEFRRHQYAQHSRGPQKYG